MGARLLMVLVFCAATAGSVLYPPPPPGTPAARASCPEQADANAPDEAPSAPSGSFAENHDETAKHLVPFDLTHPQACRLADLADPGAAPLGSRLPPPPPPPPNPAA